MADRTTLGQVVAWGQWSSSWLFVGGLVVILLGPSWWSIAIGAWFGGWLVLGMGLSVKRGGWGLVAALVLEAFIVFSGVGVVHWLLESSRAAGADEVLRRIHEGADWKATSAALTQAQGLVTTLSARLSALPADWVTKAGEVAAQVETQQATVQQLAGHLTELEAGAKTAAVVTGSTAFEAFGPNSVIVVLFILGIGNELVAMANMIRKRVPRSEWEPESARSPQAEPTPTATVPTPVAVSETMDPVPLRPEQEPGVEDYLRVAREFGRGNTLAGYRIVCEKLGISERKGKELLAQAFRKGLIQRSAPGEAAVPA